MMLWQKTWAGLMLGVACVTSPCCTPFIVLLGLALLAGTPAAIWLTHYIGWLYGGLTVVSILSLVGPGHKKVYTYGKQKIHTLSTKTDILGAK